MTSDAGPRADATSLAFDRTYLAYERTLLAWIRTATSLITFGFTLYKFFSYLRESSPGKQPEQLLGPRSYGLVMIGGGIFSLVAATMQHRVAVKALRRQYPAAPVSLATVVAALIGGLGVLAFVAAILRQ